MGSFQRTNAKMDQLGFVRGPARLLAAPITQTVPTQISDVIKLSGADVNEVQTLTITGVPTGGTFKLTYKSISTGTISATATAAAVQTALEGILGVGNVTATGGPLPGTAVVITFAGTLAAQNVPLIQVTSPAFVGGTTPAGSVVETTAGSGLYDPLGTWFDLGGTKNGVVPAYNNAEDEFTIDQQTTAVGSQQNAHTWSFQTSLVEVTLENLALAWDMGPVTLNAVPPIPEKRMGMGTPRSYTQRRIAIVHRRHTGLLRLHLFRIMQRQPVDSSLTYASTGDQQSVPLSMRALVDETISVDTDTVGFILDQQG